MELITLNLPYITITLAGFAAVLLIWLIVLTISSQRTGKKLKALLGGENAESIEKVILENIERAEDAAKKVSEMEKKLAELQKQLQGCVQKVEIIRYNAFADTGSDLSFSLALLDMENDGLLLTGIYGRNESYTYAKPIHKGESKYALSTEELDVLNKSMKSR